MTSVSKKIKICHITTLHRRYDMRIFRKECVSLLNNGFDVSLIVADNKGNEIKDGVSIFDIGKASGKLNRIKSLQKAYQKALSINAAVYHFHDPELLFIGLKLKRAGKKVIWDMHENLPADIMQKKYIPYFIRVLVTVAFKLLENYTVKRIDGVICTRDSVVFRLYDKIDSITVINNFPLINYDVIIPETRERAICFAGAIVSNYQHKEIIEAISEIEDVKYLLAGPVKSTYLDVLRSTKGWEKVEYLGVLSFEEVNAMYARSQIGMVVHKYTQNMDWLVGNFALTKIFEVMYWRMPVIATDYSLWQETVFDQYDCALTVNPNSVNEIRQAIQKLLADESRIKRMGVEGQKAVLEKFNWQSQEKKLIKFYNEVLLKN